jgi:flavin-dependent dehydrogenase
VTATVHDALVIGAGPAGGTAALLLAQAGWSVVLVERKEFPRPKVCGEYLSATNLPLLDRLGVGAAFRELAGPPVRRVGLFAGKQTVLAALPLPASSGGEYGRALSRARLDTLLLERARQAGAAIRQPWKVEEIEGAGGLFRCRARSEADGQVAELAARVVVAAHGSWEPGPLPTQPRRQPASTGDLLGFKAHFEGSSLEPGLMPLLAFPGGYGGMVQCEDGRVSLSCCVRRDQLTRLRRRHPGDAGDAVLAHIRHECSAADKALRPARRVGAWLSAGPLRPGRRQLPRTGVFLVGNAAGEAHPVIAEGITMALQSAWLLCSQLIRWKKSAGTASALGRLGRAYAADWRRHFATRMLLSSMVAHWAMRPCAVACGLPMLNAFPPLLTWFARLSGKAYRVL